MIVFVIANYPSNYVIDKGGICVAVSVYFYIGSLLSNTISEAAGARLDKSSIRL